MSRVTAPTVREGALIKGYRVGRCIGTGSMGEVYEAKHETTGKRVALKLLKHGAGTELNASRRLLEEARAANAIRHPGIVEVLDVGLMGERPWLALELLVGKPLSVRLKQGLMPIDEVTRVLEGILAALGAAHRAGVVHRDLKPSNVFLADPPASARVKLLDFGVARREGRTEQLTAAEMAVGSMGFMAPEQLMGHAVPSSDLYAVGCLAFLMLSGKPVFPLRNIPDNARMHVMDKPPRLRSLRPEVPPALETWVEQLLAKTPELRPPSPDLALAALRGEDGGSRTEVVAAFVPGVPTQPHARAATHTIDDVGPDETLIDS